MGVNASRGVSLALSSVAPDDDILKAQMPTFQAAAAIRKLSEKCMESFPAPVIPVHFV